MVIDWLAAGLDPDKATIFIQSRLPEHAELFTLLAMGTPLGWLERMPTYKDQIERLKDRDLATYGFLGYPLLQAADILIYKAAFVPVGDDQAPHVEITREVARRFNHLYGREPDFEELAAGGVQEAEQGPDREEVRGGAQDLPAEGGEMRSWLDAARLIDRQRARSSSADDRERLDGYLRGTGKTILVEPQALHTEVKKLPGLDGTKMSKSYGNAIAMREEPAEVERKIRRMQTDPARVRRTDPGDPEKCPVWQLHKVYSNDETKAWVVARLHDRGDRLPRLQAAGDRGDPARAGAVARARRAVPREPEARALDRRGRHRAGAHRRARDDARGARRDGPVATSDRIRVAVGRARRTHRRRFQWRAARLPFADAAPETGAALLPSRLSVPAKSRLMLALWRQISSRPEIASSASAIASGPSVSTLPERREHRGDDRRPATNSGRTRR